MLPYFNQFLYLNGNIPFSCSLGYSDVLDCSDYFTALVNTYPSNLRQKYPPVINLKALWKPYAIIHASFLIYRSSLQWLAFIEAIPESPFQILQLLLQNLRRALLQKTVLLGSFPFPPGPSP